jgi:hypothetical protein
LPEARRAAGRGHAAVQALQAGGHGDAGGRNAGAFADEIQAKVQTVDRLVDSTASTLSIVAELDNAKQGVPAGIPCKLRVPGLK